MATVLVYSDDPQIRDRVRTAVGTRPAPDLAAITWVELGSGPDVVATCDAGGIDVAIFDGEAWPTGGLGLSRQLKNEIVNCPLILVLIARADDRWLAAWSQADRYVPLPVDPVQISEAVVELLRAAASRVPVPAQGHGLRGLFRRG